MRFRPESRRRAAACGLTIGRTIFLGFAVALAFAPISSGDPSSPGAGALRSSGPRAESPKETAARLNEEATADLERGEIPRAIERLTQALTIDPENGVVLANLTLAYLRNGDSEFAEFYLELARQMTYRENPDPRVYVVLGDVYERQERLEDAVLAWQHAEELGSRDPDIRRKLARVQQEWALEHGQKYFAGERFEFFYDPSIADSEVREVNDDLEKSTQVLAEFFLSKPVSHLIVILYAGRRFFELLETPDWVGGFYDGKIRVPLVPGQVQNQVFVDLLQHELAHAFLARLSRGRAPAWLQEGLAQFAEGRRVSDEELKEFSAVDVAGFPRDSETSFRQRSDRVQARMAYMLSLSFVQFLVHARGGSAAVCLTEALGRGSSLAEAFRENFGESAEEAEAAWKSTLHLAAGAHPKK